MREKIAEAIRDEVGCGYNGELIDVGGGADKILALISEEIEKVENPYVNKVVTSDAFWGFVQCLQKVLALFRPIENPVGRADP
jgi:hypothetical protein